jgi:CRP-like cAMP-binding protein
MSADMIRFLKKVPFLSGLPERDLLRLGAREVRFAAQEAIAREGEPAGDLYVIRSGSVDIVKGYGKPSRQVIAARGPGELVGEMGLYGEQSRYAAIVAREPTVVVAIPYQAFRVVVEGNPAAWQALHEVIMQLVGKLRQAQDERIRLMQRELDDCHASSVGILAYIVACLHWLQSSIEGAVGAADSIRLDEELLESAAPEMRERLALLGAAMERVQREANMISAFAGLISSQGRLLRQQVNFAGLARQVVGELQEQAAAAGVRVVLEIAAEPELPGDGARLAEAMRCLLRSVVESGAAGRVVIVWVLQRENTAYYEVSDAGGETPVDRFARAWDWSQAAAALMRGEEVGVDLMLAQYIVRGHGGDTWSRREEGGGARVGFWVPMQAGEEYDEAAWL